LAESRRAALRGNTAMNNGNLGFIEASDNSVIGNVSSDNGSPGNGTGFNFNDSSRNTVSRNVAFHNGGVGFYAFFGSELNTFSADRGCQNFYVDALDQSTGAGNVWTGNSFCTSDVP
jgi:parallel beta-helix repeat protein